MTSNHIRTSHAGSLPRTPRLVEANKARRDSAGGLLLDTTSQFQDLLAGEVAGLVQR